MCQTEDSAARASDTCILEPPSLIGVCTEETTLGGGLRDPEEEVRRVPDRADDTCMNGGEGYPRTLLY